MFIGRKMLIPNFFDKEGVASDSFLLPLGVGQGLKLGRGVEWDSVILESINSVNLNQVTPKAQQP